MFTLKSNTNEKSKDTIYSFRKRVQEVGDRMRCMQQNANIWEIPCTKLYISLVQSKWNIYKNKLELDINKLQLT